MLAVILLVLLLASILAMIIGGLVWWKGAYRHQGKGLVTTGLSFGFALIFLAVFDHFGPFIAGQGDALEDARAWTQQHRPGGEATCMGVDSDGDKYVTCTVSWKAKPDEPETIETLRCGVNRWFHGYGVKGCQPLIPTRGAIFVNGGGISTSGKR